MTIMQAPERGRCTSCREPVLWAISTKDRPMPLDVEPVADGNVVVRGIVAHVLGPMDIALLDEATPRYVAHFVTCPNADAHRKPKGRR